MTAAEPAMVGAYRIDSHCVEAAEYARQRDSRDGPSVFGAERLWEPMPLPASTSEVRHSAAPTPAPPGSDRRRERGLVWLGVGGAILAFVMLAGLWMSVPVYRPPDEASHVAYARELSHGRLPRIDTAISSGGDLRLTQELSGRDATHRTIWTANHPPLYYALVAVPLRVGSDTGHPIRGVLAARLVSVGLSALGLIVLAYVVLQLVPGRPQLAVAATGLVALLPSFISISARVYNDSLAFLTATMALAAAVVFVVRGPSAARLAAVAAAASLAALTRASGLLVAGVAGVAVLVAVWRAGGGSAPRRLARAAVWTGAVGAAVAAATGWFYLRNLTLYGDITGSAALLDQFGRAPKATIVELLTDPSFWRLQQRRLWDVTNLLPSTDPAPARHLWLLGLVPVAGLLLAGARRLARPSAGGSRVDPGRTMAFCLCVVLLGLLQLSQVQFVSAGGGGHVRYLFPGLVTVGVIAAAGLAALPGGRHGVPAVAMLLAMAAVNLWLWWAYLDVGISQPPSWRAATLPGFLVGLGLLTGALWRLRPDAARPVPSAT
jgi:hypothetical protein